MIKRKYIIHLKSEVKRGNDSCSHDDKVNKTCFIWNAIPGPNGMYLLRWVSIPLICGDTFVWPQMCSRKCGNPRTRVTKDGIGSFQSRYGLQKLHYESLPCRTPFFYSGLKPATFQRDIREAYFQAVTKNVTQMRWQWTRRTCFPRQAWKWKRPTFAFWGLYDLHTVRLHYMGYNACTVFNSHFSKSCFLLLRRRILCAIDVHGYGLIQECRDNCTISLRCTLVWNVKLAMI